MSVSYSSLTVQCGLKPHSMPPPATPKISQTLIFEPLGRCNIQQRRFLRHAQPEFPAGFFLLVPHTRKEREI